MDRIPLLSHKTTPSFVEDVLAVFGNNPYREPLFRLIWSERKQIYFAGEVVPEYFYLASPCWVLETWIDPMKDAGPEAGWDEMKAAFMGPYPRNGTYNFVQAFPSDWYPTEESVRFIAKGIQESRDIAMADRKRAIKENLEQKAKLARQIVADEIVELQDSASLGKIQQSISGPKNTFRTADDYGRDLERATPQKQSTKLPVSGGKIIR